MNAMEPRESGGEMLRVMHALAESLDVLGLLRARGEILEREYLERMADSLGVRDLLTRAGQEA